MLASSPTAVEDRQMLATKPPPPIRLHDDIGEDLLFPYHAQVDRHRKVGGIVDFHLHPSTNHKIRQSLAATLSRAGSFRDNRALYVNERPVSESSEKEHRTSGQAPVAVTTTPFSDLSVVVKARLSSTFNSYLIAQGHASAAKDVLITEIVTPKNPAFDRRKADGAIAEELGVLLDMNTVNMGKGSDHSEGPLKFGGLGVEQVHDHLVCH